MAIRKVNTKFRLVRNKDGVIDIDETLFNQRHIFITDEITPDLADYIIKQLLTLDMMSDEPIQLYVNSPGGCVSSGFAIIDVMQKLRSKIITIASGQVASMGTLIAIAGKERKCFNNTIFMLHDLFGGGSDYSQKLKDRMKFLDNYYLQLEAHIKNHTKLSQQEIDASRIGEVWLFAKEALEKGLVDQII